LVTRAVSPVEDKKKRSLPIKGNGHKPQLIIGREDALRDLDQPLPRFSLRDVNGDVVNSEEFLGRDTLLLFWEPKCPFCQAMSGDVASWEENPPKGAPRLVFVSSGEEEAVRAESGKFKSRFLYDPELEVSLLFGTNLTPSAVLIDRTGRIASPPTAGRLEILTLAGVRKSAAPVASVHEHTQPAIAE
jgi:peroxiredoxin